MINKAHIKIGDVVYGSSDSVDIMYDENTNVYDKITNMSNAMAYIDIEDNENIEYTESPITSIIIDDTLSETSINPVQNKVITNELSRISEEINSLKQTGVGGTSTSYDETTGNLTINSSSSSYDEVTGNLTI